MDARIKTILLFLLASASIIMTAAHGQVPREPLRIDWGNTESAVNSSICSDAGRVFIVWTDTRTGNPGVYFSASRDNGLTFGSPARLDQDTTGAGKEVAPTSVIVQGRHVYVWWYDERTASGVADIYFTVSHDRGNTFGAEVRIDDTGAAGQFAVRQACMAASGPNVFLAMAVEINGASEAVFATASDNGGYSFRRTIHIGHGNPGDFDVDNLGLDCHGVKAYLAFDDDRRGNDDVYGIAFTSTGQKGSLVRIDTDSTGVGDVEHTVQVVMTSFQDIHVLWQEERAGSTSEELRYNRSIDGGASFMTDMLLGGYTPGVSDVDHPEMAAEGTGVIVAFENDRTGTDEVYLTASGNGGASWIPDYQISTACGSLPRVAMRGGMAGVAWTGGGFPDEAFVAWSRDGGASFGSPINMSSSQRDADSIHITLDPLYNSCHVAYLDENLGKTNLYTCAFRSAGLTLDGRPRPGDPVRFQLTNALADESGGSHGFQVLLANSTGSLKIPWDGRPIGLTFDPLLQASLGHRMLLSGAVLTDGSGDTQTFNFPNLAVGRTIQAVALVRLAQGGIGSITDPLEIVVE